MKLMQKFLSKTHKTNQCWLWLGAKDRKGYGRFWDGTRSWLSHRWLYTQSIAPIDQNLSLCHHCDNPPCVNPAHMFVGTQSDNMKDALRKGRINPNTSAAVIVAKNKTHCRNGHKYTPENTRIRRTFGTRICEQCRARGQRERKRTLTCVCVICGNKIPNQKELVQTCGLPCFKILQLFHATKRKHKMALADWLLEKAGID